MAKESELGKAVIPIEADLAGLEKSIGKVQRKLEGPLAKIAKRVGSTVSKVAKAAVVGGVGTIVAGIAGAAKLALDALPIQGVSDAFAGITGDADKMIAKLREGSLGMVRDADLMMSYNSAAQLVSKTFADQLPDAMGYLSKVSAATGQDMGFMIDSMVKGVGRLSGPILDNLGIQVALSEATAEASKMFGVQAEELTKAQTQAGMMNVVLAKLAENTAKMPGIAGTANAAWASLGTTMGNLKDRIGVGLAPMLQSLLTPLAKAGEYLTLAFDKPQVQEFIARLSERVGAFGEKLGRVIDKLAAGDVEGALRRAFGAEVAEKILAVADSMGTVADGVRDVIGFLSSLDPVTVKVAAGAVGLAVAIPKITAAVGTLSVALKGLGVLMATNPIGLAATALVLAGVGIAAVVEKIKKSQQAVAEATQTADQKIAASAKTYDEYVAVMTGFLRVQRDVPAGMSDAVLAMHAVEDGLIQTREAWELLQIRLGEPVEISFADEFLADMGIVQEAIAQGAGVGPAISDQLQASIASSSAFFDEMSAMAQAKRAQMDAILLEARATGLGEELALMQTHQQALLELESSYQSQLAETDFANNLARLQAIQQYEAEKAGLLAAGRTEDAAELTASHGEELAEMERANALAAQLNERKYLQQRMEMMQAHAKEMQELRNQTIRVQAEKLRQAAMEGSISQWSADHQLAILYKGTDDRMQREKVVADKEAEIAKLLALGKIAEARAVQDALVALRNEDAIAADKAKTAAEQAFKDFRITLPPMPPIDVGPLVGSRGSVASAAQKVVKPVAEKLAEVTRGINQSVDQSLQAIGKLAHLKFPEGVLENFRALGRFVTTGVTILYEAVKPVSPKVAELMERTVGSIGKSVETFVEFAKLKQVFAKPPEMGNARAWMAGFLEVVAELMGAAEEALAGRGGGQRAYNEIKRLQKTTRKFEKMFSIITLDYSKISQLQLPDMPTWGARFKELFITLVQSIWELREILGKGRIEKVAALVQPFQAMLELVLTDMSELESRQIPEGMPEHFEDLKAVLIQALEVLQSIETDVGLPAIGVAMTVAEQMATVTDFLMGMDLEKLAPRDQGDFGEILTTYFDQLMATIGEAARRLSGVDDDTRELYAEAAALVPDLKAVGGLVGAIDPSQIVPSTSETFEADVDAYFGQLEGVAEVALGWLGRLKAKWGEVLEELGPVAKHVVDAFAITRVGTEVSTPDATFLTKLTTFLGAVVEATPLVKGALDKIKAGWASAEAMAEDVDLSGRVEKFFGILNLSKLFEELQTKKKLGAGEHRVALSEVIKGFLLEIENSLPMLKAGLETADALMDGAWEKTQSVADKLRSVFESLAAAVKAGASAVTEGDWNLSGLLSMIDQLATATQAVGQIQMPTWAGGMPTAPAMAGTIPESPLLGGNGGNGGLYDAAKAGIVDGLRGSELVLELRIQQEAEERRRFSVRLGRMERLMATLVTRMEAGGA